MNTPKPKLLDQVRDLIRLRHMSCKTERANVAYIRDYILFHNKQHPAGMGVDEIRAYPTHLAVDKNVAASPQNVAFNALLFLYKQVLGIEQPAIEGVLRAKRPARLPTVFTRDEALRLIQSLDGVPKLVASLLYGSGLRLTEALRLRVKDIDFQARMITVRDGKGFKDRTALFPDDLVERLPQHLERVREIHSSDLARGFGSAPLPYALARKYPRAEKEFSWQYVFPSTRLSPSS